MSLAQRVRDFRYSKGWGPDELANRAEISRTALYQIESGKTELPRAGTLRRIAMALDVSMETLLGHPDAAVAGSAQNMPSGPNAPQRGRNGSEWYPVNEGPTLGSPGLRPTSRYEHETRFGVEYAQSSEGALISRERDLSRKLHELLLTPLGDPVARIVEETYRLIPQARVAATYD